ncbi:MAG TPA: Rieske 2Fe-2S domain-containing protein [Longimicrobiales bacterium]
MVTRAFEDAVESALERMGPVEEAGFQVARTVHDAVLRDERRRRVADALHGTWLGHPLHPVLTDVTIGSWVLGGAFDLVGALTGSRFARRAGDTLARIGTASAVPTALAGVADYSTIPQPAAATGTLHGMLNAAGLGLYLLSLRDRRNGRRGRGLLFSSLALGVATASAWLGGHLVYRHRVGVDHSDEFTGPRDWTPVLDVDELGDREPTRVEVEGKGVLLFREGNDVYAIGAVCAHAGGPLEEGKFYNTCVQCPWHDSVFDLSDGHIVHGPATQPQPVFDTRIRGGMVELKLRHA